ncbi:MAG: cytidine deaminase [Bacteroidetes bacterium]|nr:MAG: cytidine deaminase [Bacteroidota bacterium]PTM12523.1 MAG: cytidine deaminase [Bacteroidota bacterium]
MENKQQQLEVKWETFTDETALSASQKTLLAAAKTALDKAYAPYSKFQVGAALLLTNGAIVSGANFENAAYPMCLCAERMALATAVSSYPGERITHIAITVRNPAKPVNQPAAPCGACRQVMVEVEQRQGGDMEVLLQGEQGAIMVLKSAKVLLPFYFDGSFL